MREQGVGVTIGERLMRIYERLLCSYGPQGWWPAESPFEVIIGAILTQSAAWVNVERALANLKARSALGPAALRQMPLEELACLIYPSGYYNAKALKVKAFVGRLGEGYEGSLERLFSLETGLLRRELLSIHGIGEETADSIILYAAGRPVFVIDAYTRRILRRLGPYPQKDSYASLQTLFMDNLSQDARLFNEYHALLVRHGKTVCRRAPHCAECCLSAMCPSRAGSGSTGLTI